MTGQMSRAWAQTRWLALLCCLAALPLTAGATDDAQSLSDEALETLVGPVALYPDDLLAIVLPASTYPLQIVQAARFLDAVEDNPDLAPDPDWDPSVVALLNYPEVVRKLDADLDWTWSLGQAVLMRQEDVIAAAGRFREAARASGNLESDAYRQVDVNDGVVAIRSTDPEVLYVPDYQPAQVRVYHRAPVYHYYPRPYPVYYYPYPADYHFRHGYFWGVTHVFTIGWHHHRVLVHPHSHVRHPYHHRSYAYSRYHYLRPRTRLVPHDGFGGHLDPYVWQPSRHHAGPRPGYRHPEGYRDNRYRRDERDYARRWEGQRRDHRDGRDGRDGRGERDRGEGRQDRDHRRDADRRSEESALAARLNAPRSRSPMQPAPGRTGFQAPRAPAQARASSPPAPRHQAPQSRPARSSPSAPPAPPPAAAAPSDNPAMRARLQAPQVRSNAAIGRQPRNERPANNNVRQNHH